MPSTKQAMAAVAALSLSTAIATPISAAPKQPVHKRQSGPQMNGQNFADPSIMSSGDNVYAFATTSNSINIQMASIANNMFNQPGQSWNYSTADALPQVPSWVAPGTTWAPDVNQFTDFDNSFGLYYAGKTTMGPNGGVHCLGLARSGSIEGPYSDGSTEPWMMAEGYVCQTDKGGQIDPALFVDKDGSWYITYKIDGPASCPMNDAPGTGFCGGQSADYVSSNCPSTPIMLHKLGTNSDGQVDGYTLDKDDTTWPLTLIDNMGGDDNYNIEAPSLVLSSDNSTYFLFFSRGCYNDGSYTLSYTTASSVTGPWNGPRTDLLVTGDKATNGDTLYAPGGADVTLVNALMVFHADYADTNGDDRALATATLVFDGSSVTLANTGG